MTLLYLGDTRLVAFSSTPLLTCTQLPLISAGPAVKRVSRGRTLSAGNLGQAAENEKLCAMSSVFSYTPSMRTDTHTHSHTQMDSLKYTEGMIGAQNICDSQRTILKTSGELSRLVARQHKMKVCRSPDTWPGTALTAQFKT